MAGLGCFLGLLVLGALLPGGAAVDRSKFRTCDQASFCRRFRRWITRPDKDQALWRLLPRSREELPEGGYRYLLQHRLDESPSLVLRLELFAAGMVRVRLTEMEPLHPRYETPPGDVVVDPPPELADAVETTELEEESLLQFTSLNSHNVLVSLQHAPFSLSLKVNGELVQHVNGQNFLNFERYRQRDASATDSQDCVDAASWPMADRDGMWAEYFNEHLDTKPRGPSAVGVDVSFGGEVAGLFGLPEHTSPSRLEDYGEPYRCFNLDVCEYELDSPMALYGTVPILHAMHRTKSGTQASGFLWLNPSDTFVGIGEKPTHSWWVSESGILDAVLLVGPSPKDVMQQYHLLTGFAPLPPLWALGKHQSRWNYENQADVRQVNAKYDEHDIPLDVIWLDIEHTDDKRYFTWDPYEFPNPLRMVEDVAASGRKLVTIVDPHVKRDPNYFLYQKVMKAGLCVQRDGAIFDGWCWSGSSVYPDFTHPAMRELWAEQFAFKEYRGTTPDVFTWNDMNEPSVFNGPEVTFPKDVVHPYDSVEHRDVHNLYGLYMQRASFEGHLRRAPHLRPFVLSRAFFAGSHRWGPVWTGDNDASWQHLAASVPMLLSLALGGQSFAGADVGGFFGHPTSELLVRWYQLASLAYPFFRQHAHEHSPRREPWLWGLETMGHIRRAVRVRYELLPYLYTTFAAFHRDGVPVLRPLWWHFMEDVRVVEDDVAADETLMVGDALLVRGIFRPIAEQSSAKVYLPGAAWYDVHSGELLAAGSHSVPLNMESIPAYWRAGSIVPMKMGSHASSKTMIAAPFTIHVFVDPNTSSAKGEVYVDDCASSSPEFFQASLSFQEGILRPVASEGSVPKGVSAEIELVVLHGLSRLPRALLLADKAARTDPQHQSLPFSSSAKGSLHEVKVGLKVGLEGAWSLKLDFAASPAAPGKNLPAATVARARPSPGIQQRGVRAASGALAGLLAGAWRAAMRPRLR